MGWLLRLRVRGRVDGETEVFDSAKRHRHQHFMSWRCPITLLQRRYPVTLVPKRLSYYSSPETEKVSYPTISSSSNTMTGNGQEPRNPKPGGCVSKPGYEVEKLHLSS